MDIGARRWDSNSATSEGLAVRQSPAPLHGTSMSEVFGGRSARPFPEQFRARKHLSLYRVTSIEWSMVTAEHRLSQEIRR